VRANAAFDDNLLCLYRRTGEAAPWTPRWNIPAFMHAHLPPSPTRLTHTPHTSQAHCNAATYLTINLPATALRWLLTFGCLHRRAGWRTRHRRAFGRRASRRPVDHGGSCLPAVRAALRSKISTSQNAYRDIPGRHMVQHCLLRTARTCLLQRGERHYVARQTGAVTLATAPRYHTSSAAHHKRSAVCCARDFLFSPVSSQFFFGAPPAARRPPPLPSGQAVRLYPTLRPRILRGGQHHTFTRLHAFLDIRTYWDYGPPRTPAAARAGALRCHATRWGCLPLPPASWHTPATAPY